MAKVRPSGTPIPPAALDLIMEEIHSQRKSSLRDWQESREKKNERVREGCKVPDDRGNDLRSLCLVHPSWTPVSRHVLGRILVLSDMRLNAAEAAFSSPTFGNWTREVYLSFSRDYNEPSGVWNAITQILARTPGLFTLSFQTASEDQYSIDTCVKKLSDDLRGFPKLRTLRLYSDITHGLSDNNGVQDIVEHPALFHALEKLAELEYFLIRGFFPCYKRVHHENLEWTSSCYYDWDDDAGPPPNLHTISQIVADSAPLSGRIYELAELIRSIANTPIDMDTASIFTAGNGMTLFSFRFNTIKRQFTLVVARISDLDDHSSDDNRVSILPTSPNQKWTHDVEILDLYASYDSAKIFFPLPSLKFLSVIFSCSMTAAAILKEVDWLLSSLPQSLEILDLAVVSDTREDIFLGFGEELDAIFATFVARHSTKLRLLVVDLDCGFGNFSCSLNSLIESCKDRRIPLRLGRNLDVENPLAGYHGWGPKHCPDILCLESHIPY